MEVAACIFALSRRDLPVYEYAGEFYRLAAETALDDAVINHLFWLGANYHHPVDLPDTTGLSWREGCVWEVSGPEPEPAHRLRLSPPAVCGAVCSRVRSGSRRVQQQLITTMYIQLQMII